MYQHTHPRALGGKSLQMCPTSSAHDAMLPVSAPSPHGRWPFGGQSLLGNNIPHHPQHQHRETFQGPVPQKEPRRHSAWKERRSGGESKLRNNIPHHLQHDHSENFQGPVPQKPRRIQCVRVQVLSI